jgi:hypothetical protein
VCLGFFLEVSESTRHCSRDARSDVLFLHQNVTSEAPAIIESLPHYLPLGYARHIAGERCSKATPSQPYQADTRKPEPAESSTRFRAGENHPAGLLLVDWRIGAQQGPWGSNRSASPELGRELGVGCWWVTGLRPEKQSRSSRSHWRSAARAIQLQQRRSPRPIFSKLLPTASSPPNTRPTSSRPPPSQTEALCLPLCLPPISNRDSSRPPARLT